MINDMIKYHQYGVGLEYGEDHSLTNNWDPNEDYGNEYVNVYFNINTPTYHYDRGFTDEQARNAWHTEASSLISSFDILEGTSFDAEQKQCAYLYAHPQQISGVVLKNEVKKIAEAINAMTHSSIRWVDLRETYYLISDEEYEKYLEEKKSEVCRELFIHAETKRRSKYFSAFSVARCVAGKIRLNRLGNQDGKEYGSGQTIEYILKVADEMIENGLLKYFEEDGKKYIRSINKTEQRAENKRISVIQLFPIPGLQPWSF